MVLTEEEFQKLGIDNTTDIELERLHKDDNLKEAYRNIVDILKKYCDLKEEYYSLVALWIIGTYNHRDYMSYPYLFFNAMRGSGKSRILRLISVLSCGGEMLNSLTEAVLFRTDGTLCIDEFEGVNRKGNESLRELLNSAYKKGTKVKRMRKKKTMEGEQQVVEEFDVFRPICIANIWGMDSVLGDRCITLILEKSGKRNITRLMEIFESDQIVKKTIKLLQQLHPTNLGILEPKDPKFDGIDVVDVVVSPVEHLYKEWNNRVENYTNYTNYTNHTNNINYTNYTNNTFLDKLFVLNIEGRHLELAMPLFIIASKIGEEVLDTTIKTFQEIVVDKKGDDMIESSDISFIDFISQEPDNKYFISINELTKKFQEFLQSHEEWINSRWVGQALKRLNLIIEKKRKKIGVEVILNVQKAIDQMWMFK